MRAKVLFARFFLWEPESVQIRFHNFLPVPFYLSVSTIIWLCNNFQFLHCVSFFI